MTIGIELIACGLVFIFVFLLDRLITKLWKLEDYDLEFIYICLFVGIGIVIVGLLKL